MTLFFRKCYKKYISPHLFLSRNIYVLGIESSFDDTSAAVVNDSGKIIGESHFSQSRIHMECGGLVVGVARNLHNHYLKKVVDTAMLLSTLNFKDLDAVAVTVKPGLQPSLLVGTEYAKDLCTLYRKPLIPIHHMEAHALTARMIEDVKFPFLVLLISGGHSLLALCESVNKFYTLGTALDGTPGQIFDKIAVRTRIRNLKEYSGMVGGAAIEKAASKGDFNKFQFPNHVLPKDKDCNFSFSGIRAVALKYIEEEERKYGIKPDGVIPSINDLCAGFLLCITRHFCQRVEIGFKYVEMEKLLRDNERVLVVSGGVACNNFIRNALRLVCDHHNYRLVVPPSKLCTDNGAMVAWNGIERLKANCPAVQPDDLESVTCESRCPLGENISRKVKSIIMRSNLRHFRLLSELEKQKKNSETEMKQSAST